jgi:hypothetical protein
VNDQAQLAAKKRPGQQDACPVPSHQQCQGEASISTNRLGRGESPERSEQSVEVGMTFKELVN